MKYPLPAPASTKRSLMLLSIALTVGLAGCAVPARISYDAKLAELCAQPNLQKVYSSAELLPTDFNARGSYVMQREAGRTSIANRFWHDTESVILQQTSNMNLIRLTTVVSKKSTGEKLGVSTTYCRQGGDSFSFNNTGECCPVPEGQDFYKDIFKKASK